MHPYLHNQQHTQVSLYYGYEVQDKLYQNGTLISKIAFYGIHSYDEFKDGNVLETHFQKVRVVFYHAEKSSKCGFVIGSITNIKNDEITVSIYSSDNLIEYVRSYLTLDSYIDFNENRISLNLNMLSIDKPSFRNAFGFRLHRYILGKLNPLLSDAKYVSHRLIYELLGINIHSYPNDAIKQLGARIAEIKDSDEAKHKKYQKLLDEVLKDADRMQRR